MAEACPGTALLTAMPSGFAGVLATGIEVAPPAHRVAAFAQHEGIAAEYRAKKIYAACNSVDAPRPGIAGPSSPAVRSLVEGFAIE